MKEKTAGKWFYVTAIIFLIITVIMFIVAFTNMGKIEDLQKEKKKTQNQIITEAPTNEQEKSMIKDKKNTINKLENEINDRVNDNSLLSSLKSLIESFIKAITFDNLKEKGLGNIQAQIKEKTTTACYNKLLKAFNFEDESYQKYDIDKYWYGTNKNGDPEVVCLVRYENNDLSVTKYLDFCFCYDEESDKYLISDLISTE